MNEPQQQQVRTDAVKRVLDYSITWDVIEAILSLTDTELQFTRVYLEMNAPTPRAKRRDAGKPRTKPDQRSIAEISRGESAKAS